LLEIPVNRADETNDPDQEASNYQQGSSAFRTRPIHAARDEYRRDRAYGQLVSNLPAGKHLCAFVFKPWNPRAPRAGSLYMKLFKK